MWSFLPYKKKMGFRLAFISLLLLPSQGIITRFICPGRGMTERKIQCKINKGKKRQKKRKSGSDSNGKRLSKTDLQQELYETIS